ncbi:class I SAM-dependent methyltransferase [Winogradskyella sp. SYSU M77433]|uniref:class I SAM-dependent methyltransferase n=1 Tax=Winogradskyella sp. SYSU M77433 TaxID=3042722 RepID=UPI002481974C|nr:class I SAM-dependent methyltransferase [Winogradskyella sp. SYSU M77433]MDH7911149.1 class I SAM-dependent methyltransferase [Winogradskyella sp. SYSU M77433]
MNVIIRTVKKIHRDGFSRTFRAMYSHLYDLYFDWKNSTDTVSWISHEELIRENDIAKYSVHYQGCNAYLVKSILKKLKLPKNQTFIDMGCGKGKILLLANSYGFKQVKGIELSKKLCGIAKRNILSFESKTNSKSNISVEIEMLQPMNFSLKIVSYLCITLLME